MIPYDSVRPAIYTVGYSTLPFARFLELLQQHEITAVADVRSSPFSRFNPAFQREALQGALMQAGIAYVFLGQELGARSQDPACYVEGKVQYRRLAETDSFRRGLDRVEAGAERYRLALMCAEAAPTECHRTILVARELVARGWPVLHVHTDGALESHGDLLDRLIIEQGMPSARQGALFSGMDPFELAYAKQEAAIAYVDEKLKRQGVAEGD